MNPNNTETNPPQPIPQPPSDAATTPETPVDAPVSIQPVPPSPEMTQPVLSSAPQQPQRPTQFTRLKSIFLKVLIGCLIASAVVAVVAILAGGLGDIGGKALSTIAVVAAHAVLALGFLSMDGTYDEDGELKVFTNVVFGILILSFMTATLSVWDVIQDGTAAKLYLCYGVLLVAVLHGEVLARVLNRQKLTNNIVYANFATMSLVVVMLWIWILAPDLVKALDPFFLRILAAAAVIDGTLTLTAIILDRLYLSKHPQPISANSVATKPPRKASSVLVIVVVVLLAIQLLPALFFALLGLS